MLNDGQIPIYEPGLEPLVERNLSAGRLKFSTDVGEAVRDSEVIFIAVGTPPGEDGTADLQHVHAVADTIGRNLNDEKVVITKRTVPVGTAKRVRATIETLTDIRVHVCSNPEFLKEGAAVDDFMKPDRVVVGVDSEHARSILEQLYSPFMRTGNPMLFMDVPSAEITKYAANAMLATRISFMNMVAALCDATGADVTMVRKGVGTDSRIGNSFLFAGCGYGGSCFPKDVKALIRTMADSDVDASLLVAVEGINEAQKRLLLDRILRRFGGDMSDKVVAVWGLSFKPETDDMREAPALVVINGLLDAGARVQVHDPQAIEIARTLFEDRVQYCEQNYDALHSADALAILTEWKPYRTPDFDRMKRRMRQPIIFDGRNLFSPELMARQGFEYLGIGRPHVTPAPAEANAIASRP
jgi:UDPglucose 6-dehydrogenase